jgi:putative tryptophan/tyrosine transport system substrate-binding protein
VGQVQRRKLLVAAGLLLAAPLGSYAQQSKRLPRIGVLEPRSAAESSPTRESFELGLRELGWVDGQNIVIDYRFTEGKPERYAPLVAEFVRLNVSVIVAAGEPVILAAKQATSSIPIVMASVGDPVARGFAVSLARPGGNITGVSNLAVGFPAKWLELIRELLPRAASVAVLRNLANPTHDRLWQEAELGAAALELKVVSVGIRSADDLENAFAGMAKQKAAAIAVLPDPITFAHSTRIASLAERQRLPSVYLFRENVIAGGFMSYGPSQRDNWRRAAAYVDKILKGAKPGDLPIEQPTRFELVINMKTTKLLGIKIPQSMLLRADEVIQ